MSFVTILAFMVALHAALGLLTYKLSLRDCRQNYHLPTRKCVRAALWLGALGPFGLLTFWLLTLDNDPDAFRQ